MKGIKCCGDCGYYNWKKHKCTRIVDDSNTQDHFYKDCPLPDAEPVIHGLWIRQKGSAHVFKCSACGFVFAGAAIAKYCPNCGAKMNVEQGDS